MRIQDIVYNKKEAIAVASWLLNMCHIGCRLYDGISQILNPKKIIVILGLFVNPFFIEIVRKNT